MNRILNFIRGLLVNRISKFGVVLVTSAFISFIVLEFFSLVGIYTNAYFGLITYLLLPGLFLFGLLLIPLGWWRHKVTSGENMAALLADSFSTEDIQKRWRGSNLFVWLMIFTFINILFIVGASVRTLHFMDSAYFCGNACHSVMHPEWIVYQESPHARVPCVECHVGEGMGALVDSKLNGVRQMFSATFDLYERPIPTPVHRLRPSRETCEKCHWPDQFYGNRIIRITHYLPDSSNTPEYTTLAMKIDNEKDRNAGIHWHISRDLRVLYSSKDDAREEMVEIRVEDGQGAGRIYTNRRLKGPVETGKGLREMDCVDCHNRATHRYEDPSKAVDMAIVHGDIPAELPFIKREALAVLTANYPDKSAGLTGIGQRLEGYYTAVEFPTSPGDVEQAIVACQKIYKRNIHPLMNVNWNPYPDYIGHQHDGGCFRCHNEDLVDESGNHIPYDCTTCHSILAWDSPDAFQFLQAVDSTTTDLHLHQYLQREFMELGK